MRQKSHRFFFSRRRLLSRFGAFFVEERGAANIVPERSVSLPLPFVPRRRPARHLLPHFHCFCYIHTSTSIRRRRTRRRHS